MLLVLLLSISRVLILRITKYIIIKNMILSTILIDIDFSFNNSTPLLCRISIQGCLKKLKIRCIIDGNKTTKKTEKPGVICPPLPFSRQTIILPTLLALNLLRDSLISINKIKFYLQILKCKVLNSLIQHKAKNPPF